MKRLLLLATLLSACILEAPRRRHQRKGPSQRERAQQKRAAAEAKKQAKQQIRELKQKEQAEALEAEKKRAMLDRLAQKKAAAAERDKHRQARILAKQEEKERKKQMLLDAAQQAQEIAQEYGPAPKPRTIVPAPTPMPSPHFLQRLRHDADHNLPRSKSPVREAHADEELAITLVEKTAADEVDDGTRDNDDAHNEDVPAATALAVIGKAVQVRLASQAVIERIATPPVTFEDTELEAAAAALEQAEREAQAKAKAKAIAQEAAKAVAEAERKTQAKSEQAEREAQAKSEQAEREAQLAIEWELHLDPTVAEATELGILDEYRRIRSHLPSMLSAAAEGKFPALATKQTTDFGSWMNRALDAANTNIATAYDASAQQTQRTTVENFAAIQTAMQDLLTLLANAKEPHNDEANHFKINAGTLHRLYAQLQAHAAQSLEQLQSRLLDVRRELAMRKAMMACIARLLPESERPEVDETLILHTQDVEALAEHTGIEIMQRKLKEAQAAVKQTEKE